MEKTSSFTKDDTAFAKGIAILLLLNCHLFGNNPELGLVWNNINLTQQFSVFSGVCVAIFVILSGYGLNESIIKGVGLKKFYIKRFAYVYLNYWFIWLIFVPIGMIFFDRDINSVYGNHAIIKLIINFIGLQNIWGSPSYNETWWFMSLIIFLYLLFPFFKELILKYRHLFLIFSFCLLLIKDIQFIAENVSIFFAVSYIFPFVLGIYMSETQFFSKIAKFGFGKIFIRLIIYFVALIFFAYVRSTSLGIRADGFIGLLIILIGYEISHKNTFINKYMIFAGNHSFNIFLFHTFIVYYYFQKFIYSLRSPILMFIVLLFLSLLLSFLIEKIKVWTKFTKIYKKLIELKVKDSIIIGG
jgi:peptidoglycan/LPS O-acetylase OafA/YrhL